jgi:hypothetical protein
MSKAQIFQHLLYYSIKKRPRVQVIKSAIALDLSYPLTLDDAYIPKKLLGPKPGLRRKMLNPSRPPISPICGRYQVFTYRKSYACACVFVPGVKVLKDHEYPLGVFRIDADAVVPDREYPLQPLFVRQKYGSSIFSHCGI